jgi:biotin carboxyl carrier protein
MTPEAQRLLTLLDVESRLLKAASAAETCFIAVNETHGLTPYRQAIFWSRRRGIEAVSGLATPESGAPFMLWLERVFGHVKDGMAGAHKLSAGDLPPAIAAAWHEWLPSHALLLRWADGAMLFARDTQWDEADQLLLARLTDALATVWRSFARPSAWDYLHLRGRRKRLRLLIGVTACLLVLAVPVTSSVLAPAEMVPANPAVIRAPLDGVIDTLHIRPNDRVAVDQPLFDLNSTDIAGKLDIARRQYATADAEYRQADQAQLFDVKAKARVAILLSQRAEKQAEIAWLTSQLARILVKSPSAGIAVLDDPSTWIGRPVSVGQKVMLVAEETDAEVEAWLPVDDAGLASPGARLTLFLNADPLSPLHATVRTVAYEASPRPDNTLAYRVRAVLADAKSQPRLGLKGTARIDGETVSLAWWLFRRPLVAMRQTLGF